MLREILGYEIPNTCLVLYLGNISQEDVQGEDRYLVRVLLVASRKAITRAWYKVDPPTKEQWLSIVEEIYDMERFTHTLRMREGQFEGKWEKMNDYRRGEDDTTSNDN